jgi:hypothetical protein
VSRPRLWWPLAAFAFLAAGVLDTYAALLHWAPCVAVDFDTPACIDAQRDYRYYLPYVLDAAGWQPVRAAASLAAGAFFATAIGWLLAVAGLGLVAGPFRSVLWFPALLPVLYGIEVLAGLAGEATAASRLDIGVALFSLAVLVVSAIVAESVIRTRLVVPALVAVLGLIVVNAHGFPAQYLTYLWWSAFYGSFDNPPYLGLERGVLALGIGLILGLVAALWRPASPAHGAGATLERAAHR